ncbi:MULTISPECIES: hypothetical protein [unclassified Bradyrhizobium]|uniref:hypothetical protein n=1 Tax=unclassified Bradyrhizobium TaxID=2631580 RepID=UPI0035134274
MSRRDRDTLWHQVHRRSLERALARKKTTHFNLIVPPADGTDRYEELRAAVLGGELNACFASAFSAAKGGSLHGSGRSGSAATPRWRAAIIRLRQRSRSIHCL